MRAVTGHVGACGTDSVQPITSGAAALTLHFDGKIDFVVRYLESVTAEEVARITSAGLGFMSVTFANRFEDPTKALAALGLPAGVTVWLDVEGIPGHDPADLAGLVNGWARAVAAAGFQPGMYVGVGCPLTSDELYALEVVRYWRAPGSLRDRYNQLVEPACGWCVTQLWPSQSLAGLWADVDVVGEDFRGRLPTWAAE